MRLAYFPKYAARNSGAVIDAMIQGFQQHGVYCQPDSLEGDVALIWSQLWAGRMRPNQEIYHSYRSKNRPVIVIDAGCLHRDTTWRISINGTAYLGDQQHDRRRRNHLKLNLKPWRQRRGPDILLALQRPDSNQWQGQPEIRQWCHAVIADLRRHTDRPIKIRPHPRFNFDINIANVDVVPPQKIVGTYDAVDFVSALDHSWAVINWNSTPGVVAAVQGIPVFTGPNSLAAPVSNLDWTKIEDPMMPDREQWANNLAWTEWTVDEMRQGIPQRLVLDQLFDQ